MAATARWRTPAWPLVVSDRGLHNGVARDHPTRRVRSPGLGWVTPAEPVCTFCDALARAFQWSTNAGIGGPGGSGLLMSPGGALQARFLVAPART